LFKKERIIIIMYNVFGDESADEKAQRVYTVAGMGGSEEEWNELEFVWLERTKGIIFHPADCESDRKDYKGFSHDENQKLYRDLVNILVGTKLLGFAVSTDLGALRDCMPSAKGDIWPYYYCFSRVLQYFLKIVYVSIPQEKVKFSFHLNSKTQTSASALYDYILELPKDEWQFNPLLSDEISFIGREGTVGIQVACLWAREAMKDFDNFFIGPRKRRERESMKVLVATGRYQFGYLDREAYERYKREYTDLISKANVSGENESYKAWLKKQKLDDSFGNGIRYLDYIRRLAKAKTLPNETASSE
jgi:hypothetical protein